MRVMVNPNKVYTGKVGAKMKPLFSTVKRKPIEKVRFTCMDGPLKGETLMLQRDGGTLPIRVGDKIGRYRHGRWVSAKILHDTDRIPPDIKPVHVGVYKVWVAGHGCEVRRFARWDGQRWGVACLDHDKAETNRLMPESDSEVLGWCGATEQA